MKKAGIKNEHEKQSIMHWKFLESYWKSEANIQLFQLTQTNEMHVIRTTHVYIPVHWSLL